MEFDEVFETELKDVRDRRSQQAGAGEDGLPTFEAPSKILGDALTEPQVETANKAWDSAKEGGTVKHTGLVGLALSGGGIRSATFNLGVLQALKKYNVFDRIDYLSTVSGGGYIGSCLSSVLTQTEAFPFEHTMGQKESRPFRHLRDYSNYLAPRGLLDMLRIPALLLRGVLINFLVILPYILLAVFITVLIKPTEDALKSHFLKGFLENYWPLPSHFGESFLVTKILIFLSVVGLLLYPLGQYVLQKKQYYGLSRWIARDRYGRNCGIVVIVIAVVAFIELQPLAIRYFANIGVIEKADWFQALVKDGDTWTVLATVGAIVGSLFSGKLSQKVSSWTGQLGMFAVAALGFLALWIIYLSLCRWAIFDGAAPAWLSASRGEVLTVYFVVMIVIWLYSVIFVDVNYTSLHNFYRDRLSKAYLFTWSPENDLEHNDEQPLSGLNTARAPYHLINAALNIQSADEANRRGRNADFFIFSKRFIGGELTKYCETEKLEKVRKHVNLGTAMAISGAAAAPNMGRGTIKSLVFIMAMLNIRLGYWLPNPKYVGVMGRARRQVTRVGPIYLIREMMGNLDEDSWNINLSDGGHIENLGVYELLRRECRLIIAADAERDKDLEFGGLAAVIRMAQIDMGITIEMDGLEEIRSGRQHYALGTIRYKDGKIGKLIYLKSSLVETDRLYEHVNAYVAHYKAKNSEFPHESTGDQFFDEEQFECYRALGYEVTKSVFG